MLDLRENLFSMPNSANGDAESDDRRGISDDRWQHTFALHRNQSSLRVRILWLHRRDQRFRGHLPSWRRQGTLVRNVRHGPSRRAVFRWTDLGNNRWNADIFILVHVPLDVIDSWMKGSSDFRHVHPAFKSGSRPTYLKNENCKKIVTLLFAFMNDNLPSKFFLIFQTNSIEFFSF